jgi:iron complex transport system substrate-binding protein
MKKPIVAAAVTAAVLGVVACGSGPADAATPTPAPKLFPVVVQGTNGKVTIRRRPTRIVSLSPTATETLFAIGAGRQVIAVDDRSNYPRRAPRTSLSGFTPNAEAIAEYRPDLVVLATDNGIVAALRRLGITVLQLDAARRLAGTYQQIRVLGRATGHPQIAARAVASIKRRIGKAIASARRTTASRRLSVYHELTPDFYSANSQTFIGQVYRLLGLRNIADAAADANGGYPKLSAEYIVAANPSVIVLADSKCCGQSARTVAARPGWGGIAAVRNGRVVGVDDDVASRWGPRIAGLFQAVAAALR